jgi:cbb3-type cytochrome oxidase subunit 3
MPLVRTCAEESNVMTYETVAALSQVTTLLMFVAMFAAVVTYALWPSNGAIFEKIQRQSLDLDGTSKKAGGRREQ